MELRDILRFPASFWLVTVACLAYYAAVMPFVSLAQVYFRKKFQFGAHAANFISGLVYMISVVASPVLGFLVDKTGR